MMMVLALATALSAPPEGCAPLAYCLAEAQQAFCEAWPHGLPAGLTREEQPVHDLVRMMEAKGCAVPDSPLRCPAPEPARAAPPVDCSTVIVRD